MKKNLVVTTAVAVLAFTACKNSDFEGFTKADNGLHYKFFNQDESGHKAVSGEAISIRYILKKQSNDSLIYDSKTNSPDGINRLGLDTSSTVGGIEDALKMMAKGDSAGFVLNADSFFLKTNRSKELPPFIKPGEHLYFYVKMVDIKTRKEVEENQKMQMAEREAQLQVFKDKESTDYAKYLTDNKITTQPTPSGLIYIETKKGSGPNPKANEVVKVHYTGKLLDGTTFDSSIERGQPIEFPLGQTQVIPGWEEALMLMKKGGKAKVVIPSTLAYGPQGRGSIPPYATLVFEMELVDITPGMPQQAEPMPAGH
ncbi:MAG: FKBP-type peptidyl-prolyl cis-trans isomerase [Bacteroidota bacterium]